MGERAPVGDVDDVDRLRREWAGRPVAAPDHLVTLWLWVSELGLPIGVGATPAAAWNHALQGEIAGYPGLADAGVTLAVAIEEMFRDGQVVALRVPATVAGFTAALRTIGPNDPPAVASALGLAVVPEVPLWPGR